jgi:hypothetical protein
MEKGQIRFRWLKEKIARYWKTARAVHIDFVGVLFKIKSGLTPLIPLSNQVGEGTAADHASAQRVKLGAAVPRLYTNLRGGKPLSISAALMERG